MGSAWFILFADFIEFGVQGRDVEAEAQDAGHIPLFVEDWNGSQQEGFVVNDEEFIILRPLRGDGLLH